MLQLQTEGLVNCRGAPQVLGISSLPQCPPCMTASHRRTLGLYPRCVLLAILVSQSWAPMLGFRRICSPMLSFELPCETSHGPSLMCEVSKRMYAGGMAALQYMATRLQARAVDAAPHRGAPKVTVRANCAAAIKQGCRTPETLSD